MDGISNELIFVYKGSLRFTLTMQAAATENLQAIVYKSRMLDKKEFSLSSGGYFDFFKRADEEFKDYEISSIVAEEDSQVYTLSHSLYMKYAYNEIRSNAYTFDVIRDKVSGLKDFT